MFSQNVELPSFGPPFAGFGRYVGVRKLVSGATCLSTRPTSCPSACLYTRLSTCLNTCPYTCLTTRPSSCPSVCLYARKQTSRCLCTCLYACLNTCLHTCLHACLNTHLYICLHTRVCAVVGVSIPPNNASCIKLKHMGGSILHIFLWMDPRAPAALSIFLGRNRILEHLRYKSQVCYYNLLL